MTKQVSSLSSASSLVNENNLNFTIDGKSGAPEITLAEISAAQKRLNQKAGVLIAKNIADFKIANIKLFKGKNKEEWAESCKNKDLDEIIEYMKGFLDGINTKSELGSIAKFTSDCENQLMIAFEELKKRAESSTLELCLEGYNKNVNFINNLFDVILRTYDMSMMPQDLISPRLDARGKVMNLITALSDGMEKSSNKLKKISNIDLFNLIDKFYGAVDFFNAKKTDIEHKHRNRMEYKHAANIMNIYRLIPDSLKVFIEELKERVKEYPVKLNKELGEEGKLDELVGILMQDNIKRGDIINEFTVGLRKSISQDLKKIQGTMSELRDDVIKKSKERNPAAENKIVVIKQKQKFINQKITAIQEKRPPEEIKTLEDLIRTKDEEIKAIEEEQAAKDKALDVAEKTVESQKAKDDPDILKLGQTYGSYVGSVYKTVFKKFAPNTVIKIAAESIRSATDFKVKLEVKDPAGIQKFSPVSSALDADGKSPAQQLPSIPASLISSLSYEISFEVDLMKVINQIIEKVTKLNISQILEEFNLLSPTTSIMFSADDRAKFAEGFYEGFKSSSNIIYEIEPGKTPAAGSQK